MTADFIPSADQQRLLQDQISQVSALVTQIANKSEELNQLAERIQTMLEGGHKETVNSE